MAPANVPAMNRLISSLPLKDRTRLLASCEEVNLVLETVLGEPGDRIRHVYFPIASYISLVIPADGASSLEVGMIGNEGMYGASLILNVDVSPFHSLVQGEGPALRLTAASFRREYHRSPALQRELNRYLYVLMSQLAQSAACTRFHVVEARLARWLLMTQDRAHSDAFPLTQQFLAWMLGVRRVGITKAAGALQKQQLIGYRRGNITILNRSGLEAVSCPCYKADWNVYSRMLPRAA